MLYIENLDLVELNYVKLQCEVTFLDWLNQVGNIMSFQDPTSESLTRIRNGLKRGKKVVNAPFSKFKHELVSLLVKEGYLVSCEKISLDGKDSLSISLKYINEAPAIREIKRVSKPSLRRYSSSSDLPEVKNGLGMYVLSTNKGLMSDKDARSQNIGGEVICEVF